MTMLSYQVTAGFSQPEVLTDDLYRVEFRAPVTGADGQVYEDVLIWIDNMPREIAQDLARRPVEAPTLRTSFCTRCASGPMGSEHEGHDATPDERGWLNREMTNMRIMPMREAC